MQALISLSRAIDRLNGWVGKYSIWLIFAATLISAGNAVVRKVFNYSSNSFLEVQWYLFAWAFLIAAGFTLLHREHVRGCLTDRRRGRGDPVRPPAQRAGARDVHEPILAGTSDIRLSLHASSTPRWGERFSTDAGCTPCRRRTP